MNESSEKRLDSLAARLKDGNRAAATELVDIYYQQIYLFMRRLGHSRQVSEDLTQESFLQAWQHIGQLRSGKSLNSWLYRIATNTSKLYWRRHKADKQVDIETFDVPDTDESEGDKIESLEQLGELRNIVAKLPIKFRQAVVLHYMQHLTIAEAAEALGVRKGTFKSRLNRALKAIRRQFTTQKEASL
jgi:RNA polymerase sigma-70 factor (ECF subfamily)